MALKLGKKNTKVQKVVKKVVPTTKKTTHAASAARTQVTMPTGTYTEGIGRRKVATARVRIFEGTGDFVVNGRIVGEYFATVPSAQLRYLQAFEVTGTKGKFAVSAKVSGSGSSAQLDAVVHGLSRALVKFNGEYRGLLKTAGLLSRDDRMKETRKIGMGGKARRKRQSPKR